MYRALPDLSSRRHDCKISSTICRGHPRWSVCSFGSLSSLYRNIQIVNLAVASPTSSIRFIWSSPSGYVKYYTYFSHNRVSTFPNQTKISGISFDPPTIKYMIQFQSSIYLNWFRLIKTGYLRIFTGSPGLYCLLPCTSACQDTIYEHMLFSIS